MYAVMARRLAGVTVAVTIAASALAGGFMIGQAQGVAQGAPPAPASFTQSLVPCEQVRGIDAEAEKNTTIDAEHGLLLIEFRDLEGIERRVLSATLVDHVRV